MISEKLKDILLTKRDLKADSIGEDWIKEYFDYAVNLLGIEKIEYVVCNSLQRRCSCATTRDKKIVILDNYLLELFGLFNWILEEEGNAVYLESIFYNLAFEACYVRGYSEGIRKYNKYSFVYSHKNEKMELIQEKVKEGNKYLYAQQVFLVMHEILHGYFRDYPDDYTVQKEIVLSVIHRTFNKTYKGIKMVSDEYIEEICCDHLAAYAAISISMEFGHCSDKEAAGAIILALHYQFLLFSIDRMIEEGNQSLNTSEFAVRASIVGLFVRNYFVQTRPESAESIVREISRIVDVWEKRYLPALVVFLSRQSKKK